MTERYDLRMEANSQLLDILPGLKAGDSYGAHPGIAPQ